MPRSTISLQALEVFEALTRTGSRQATADAMALSISSVSHHLGRLELALSVVLVDRTRRPMRLTAAGHRFLARVEGGWARSGRPGARRSVAASRRPAR